MTTFAAIAAAVLLLGNAGFQVALALGVPWGKAAYGGRAAREDGSLPAPYRAMSAATAVMMLFVTWLVLARAGAVGSGPLSSGFVYYGCWAVVGFMVLNTVGNLASSHPVERWLMGSSTAALVVLVGLVGWHAP